MQGEETLQDEDFFEINHKRAEYFLKDLMLKDINLWTQAKNYIVLSATQF